MTSIDKITEILYNKYTKILYMKGWRNTMSFENVVENVKITNTSITMEDYGVLTFNITVEGDGFIVNLGGYSIGSGYLGAKEFSAKNGGGLVAMMKIMNVIGVEKWEDLKGKYCRIRSGRWGSKVYIIGNIIENKWFNMKEFFEEYSDK